ncbi:Tfp pilus assembly protein ATPase PilM-like protein [Caldicellulosiruptor saccharolyticus DSM 8903]|uniref:Tfp pilus assembly protein ATPase PilM-like protein n=1 Tax=Caldicellulosiruptor saccharolyticus (strain ATCC 43494 / DSM 8903 / Tp8T 6331) TaxID=351627 RepID=A4XIE8_CALS8|nr:MULTISPECIES: pilus assembly protein PilM [Caldicellulosiruptor]ABP66683.1 Tfp pilus assembly protein ATPase PilM-like protein [Caldicellulosiruptor saccharolyticus DSM 8903]
MSEKVVVEIGKNYVRVAEGKFQNSSIEINRFFEKNLDDNIIKEDIKVDDVLLQIELRSLFNQNKVGKKNVNVIFSGISNILIRELEMPYVADDKIYNMIRHEARQYFPINIDSYVLDYKQLKIFDEGKIKKQKILIVGVHRFLIEGVINAFKNAGIKISKIDIEPNSIVKLFKNERKLNKQEDDNSYMIVNITRNGVSTSVVANNELCATKLFSLVQLEEMFKENSEQSYDYEFSLIEDLISESVIKFYDFVRTREEPITNIKKIYLTGEVCQHIDISGLLRRRLNMDVELVSDFKSVRKIESQEKSVMFAYATAFSGLI